MAKLGKNWNLRTGSFSVHELECKMATPHEMLNWNWNSKKFNIVIVRHLINYKQKQQNGGGEDTSSPL